jgi:hypothetical protein
MFRAYPISSYSRRYAYDRDMRQRTYERYREANYEYAREIQCDEKVITCLVAESLYDNSRVCLSTINGDCAICQDNINVGDIIRALGCSHVFHINCVDYWFTKQSTCPMCRADI